MIKKILLILILLLIPAYSHATEFAGAEYNVYGYNLKPEDCKKYIQKGNYYLRKFDNTYDKKLKPEYLKEALKNYYLATKSHNDCIEARIGLGRIYDEMKLDKYAKEQFFFAYNVNSSNPELNYRFGNFYYKRQYLTKARFHYEIAYKNGYANLYDLNYKMANTYNQLANSEKAAYHRKKADNIRKKELEEAHKIHSLDDNNSNNSQYYLFVK